MTLLAVDLAQRLSAACLMDDNYQVIDDFDSWTCTEDQFIFRLALRWEITPRPDQPTPEAMIVEDLPHGVKYSTLIKNVCRLQGRIVHALYKSFYGNSDSAVFVAPWQWRAHYPDLKRGTPADAVVKIAASYGYNPPLEMLHSRAKGNGGKTRADKVATDYCAAYLIARWAIDMKREHHTLDVPGTHRYGTREILLKEFHAQNV